MAKDTEKGGEKAAAKGGEKAVEKKAAAPKIEIIRGRMPLAIVAAIKFGESDLTDGACAAKYRTTNGKVSDVRKDRNFGYITDKYVPSADDLAKALEYAGQLEDKTVEAGIKKMKPATAEQTAAFDEARKSTRKTSKKPAAAAADVSEKELDGLTE